MKLQKDNRWVILAGKLPWDEMAKIYYRSLCYGMGAPAKDARLVIGALIVKHLLGLDDQETIETIRENMYIQYFLGLCEYTYKDVFDRSLFTILRYRMGNDKFDAMTCDLIKMVDESRQGHNQTKKKESTPGIETGVNTEEPKLYRRIKGNCYLMPVSLIADQIYGNRENRAYLKKYGIRFCGKPLGRPSKETLSPYKKLKQRIERGIRNQIEGKFGQGKNAYELFKVRTRTAKTSESWIACIVFIMNLIKFDQDYFINLIENWKTRLPGYIYRIATIYFFSMLYEIFTFSPSPKLVLN